MATERTAMTPFGTVVHVTENKDRMTPWGFVVNVDDLAAAGGARPQGPFGHVFHGPFAGPIG